MKCLILFLGIILLFHIDAFSRQEYFLPESVHLLSADSLEAEIACKSGEFHMQKKEYSAAYADFSKAISIHPLPKYYCRRAACLIVQNKLNEAMSDADRAIKRDSSYPEAYFLKASIYEFFGKTQDAISFYSKAIAVLPRYADAYLMRGLLYATLKKKNEACKDLQKANVLGSNKASLHIQNICENNNSK